MPQWEQQAPSFYLERFLSDEEVLLKLLTTTLTSTEASYAPIAPGTVLPFVSEDDYRETKLQATAQLLSFTRRLARHYTTGATLTAGSAAQLQRFQNAFTLCRNKLLPVTEALSTLHTEGLERFRNVTPLTDAQYSRYFQEVQVLSTRTLLAIKEAKEAADLVIRSEEMPDLIKKEFFAKVQREIMDLEEMLHHLESLTFAVSRRRTYQEILNAALEVRESHGSRATARLKELYRGEDIHIVKKLEEVERHAREEEEARRAEEATSDPALKQRHTLHLIASRNQKEILLKEIFKEVRATYLACAKKDSYCLLLARRRAREIALLTR